MNNENYGGPLLNSNGEIIGVVNAKLGSLSKFLESVEAVRANAGVYVNGVNAIETIQRMIREMKKNLNPGICYAVPTDRIKFLHDLS